MNRLSRGLWIAIACVAAAVLFLGRPGVSQESPRPATNEAKPSAAPKDKDGAENEPDARPTVAEARVQAKVLHDTYDSTLRALHRHYFKEDGKTTIPSRVLEDVFVDLNRRAKIKARWIAVNANAMSLDHEPKDDFEKFAVRQLGAGKPHHESVEDGVYRSARPIALFASCVKCHAPAPLRPDANRVAGLVLNIEVKPE